MRTLSLTVLTTLLVVGCAHPQYNVRLVDGDGAPLANTPVTVSHTGVILSKAHRGFETTTNEEGIATLEVAIPDRAMIHAAGQQASFNQIRKKETIMRSPASEESATRAVLIDLIEE